MGAAVRTMGRGAMVLALLASHFAADARGHALIVAVSDYPELERRSLAGPVHDAGLMRQVAASLGIPDANVLELSEGPRATSRPTRVAILAALEAVAQRAQRGDWVLLHFSGHGTQLPQLAWTRALNREADGLDEVFLARDARRWIPGHSVLDGAIRDDEIGLKLAPMLGRGVNVWAVFDTCHAADLVRAKPAQTPRGVVRGLSPEELGVPWPLEPPPETGASALARSHEKGAAARAANLRGRLVAPAAAPGQLIAFYASGSHEPAAEELFADPASPGTKSSFGVLTYHLHAAVLALQGAQPTFRQVADRVLAAYADRPYPTPEFSGPLNQKRLPSPERR